MSQKWTEMFWNVPNDGSDERDSNENEDDLDNYI